MNRTIAESFECRDDDAAEHHGGPGRSSRMPPAGRRERLVVGGKSHRDGGGCGQAFGVGAEDRNGASVIISPGDFMRMFRMSPVERRIKRIEEKLRNRPESGPTLAEIIRERCRKRLLAAGKEPEPERPPVRCVDERGRQLKLGEIIRLARGARLAQRQQMS